METIAQFPDHFWQTVGRIFGEEGREWLDHLPDILERCRQKWGLDEGTACPNLSINYIEFTRTKDGLPVALKVGVPNDELLSEMAALRHFDGRGAVRILDSDLELSAFIMQRIHPGTMLWETGGNHEQTRIAASLMLQLHRPLPANHGFPAFSEWLERSFAFTRTQGDAHELMPRELLKQVEAAFREIDSEKNEDVLLHGDLHHENILLDAQAGWTVIDPKGVCGAGALEVGRYIQNQLPGDGWEDLIRERVVIFEEVLNLSRRHVLNGALVDCVLSHCWDFEDEGLSEDWHRGVELGWWLVEEFKKVERIAADCVSTSALLNANALES